MTYVVTKRDFLKKVAEIALQDRREAGYVYHGGLVDAAAGLASKQINREAELDAIMFALSRYEFRGETDYTPSLVRFHR